MRVHRIHVPLAPYISSRGPPIRRHKIEYILVPPGLASKWRFSPILDWARGPTLGQTSFQTPRWVPSSLAGQVDPFVRPAIGDGVDVSSTKHFSTDSALDMYVLLILPLGRLRCMILILPLGSLRCMFLDIASCKIRITLDDYMIMGFLTILIMKMDFPKRDFPGLAIWRNICAGLAID
nr:hypothetical protein CFP56_61554 [Quercus suber]